MAIKSTTFYDPKVAARRRLVYIVCTLVVAGCGALFLVLSSGGSESPGRVEDRRAEQPAERPDDRPDPGPEPGRGTGTGTGEIRPPVHPVDRPEGLARADGLFDEGLEKLRAALRADRGSEAAIEARRAALKAFLSARDAYSTWLEANPDAERSLDRRLTELTSYISDCRKDMVLSDAPGGGDSPPSERPDPASVRPPGPTRPPPPPAVRPGSVFRPEQEATRFGAAARKALRDGRPDRILELGRPLVSDPRMEGHRGDIPGIVGLAEGMARFLEAAARTLEGQVGTETRLSLRTEEVTGRLEEAGERIRIATADGERELRISDLSSRQLLTLAELGGGLAGAEARRTAGAYLFYRGDHFDGARELLIARARGADVGPWEKGLAQVLARSPELRAHVAWLELSPRLGDRDQALVEAVDKFRTDHGATEVFVEHREALFRARADAADKVPFKLAGLYRISGKVTKSTVHLEYPFDKPVELEDFGTQGPWGIKDGALVGERGAIWLERFNMKSVDFRFVMEEAGPVLAGLWPSRRHSRSGVSLKVDVIGDKLAVALRHHDKPFGQESVDIPKGKVEFLIQKREEKYRVSLNRRLLFKATDSGRRRGEDPAAVGFAVSGAPVRILEMELKTALDMEWATGGGNRFSSWVSDWHLAGPFDLPSKDLKDGLAARWWPETEEFDPNAVGEDNKPRWKRHHAVGRIDLRTLLRTKRAAAGYAAVRVWVPDKRTGVLELEVDDDARAWMNGDLVLGAAPIGQAHRATVKLVAGDNLLLLKVVDVGGGWWAKARFLTKGGAPMRDLVCW